MEEGGSHLRSPATHLLVPAQQNGLVIEKPEVVGAEKHTEANSKSR
jgi:hypothetical protein